MYVCIFTVAFYFSYLIHIFIYLFIYKLFGALVYILKL